MDSKANLANDSYFRQLEQGLAGYANKLELSDAVVNTPFKDRRVTAFLGLALISFLLVNKASKSIERVAFTDNEFSEAVIDAGERDLRQIKIPTRHKNNFIAQAIREDHYMITTDWQFLFNPSLSADQARFLQAAAGIGYSVVYPLSHIADKGALVFNYFETIDHLGKEHHNFMARYASLVQKNFQGIT